MYSKLKSGDLLHRNKGIVQHAGVYLGNEQVLHNQPEKGVVITGYSEYAEGKDVKITSISDTDKPLLARRLREILENNSRYKLLTNNCEHIANYLISGRKMSSQVQATLVGMALGGIAKNQFKNGHWFLWLTGGAIAGLMISNLAKNYDYTITPISKH
jgi:cell wall-associated NlpC family hydrolase